MPRLRKPANERRSEYVNIPISPDELKDLDQRAKAAGMLRTRYARSLITGAKRNGRAVAAAK